MKRQILSAIIAGAVALSSASAAVLAAPEEETAVTAAETETAESAHAASDAVSEDNTEEAEEKTAEDTEQIQETDVNVNTTAEEASETDSEDAEKTDGETASENEEAAGNMAPVTTSGSFSYRVTGDGAQIVKYTGSGSEVQIPDTIEDNAVASIAANAFEGNKIIKSVTMPDTVTTIGAEAFSGCTALESVKISDNVQIINAGTFENCTALSDVRLPANLVVIYRSAFSGCTALTGISFPDTLQYLDEGAFYNCSALNNIRLPKLINDFNGSVFAGCTSLYEMSVDEENPYYTSSGSVIFTKDNSMLAAFPSAHTGIYDVPEGTSAIGYAAFYKSGLEQINLPSTLKTISNTAFAKCESLISINIPDSVSTIGAYAFSGCSALKTVTMSSSVTKIEDGTFANCPELRKITIPSSVTSLGSNVFSGCSQDCVVETETGSSAAASYAKNLGMNTVSLSSADNDNSIVTTEPVAVTVLFNEEPMEFEYPATIVNDNTVVPMRALFEKMGAQVTWSEEMYTASASLNETTVDVAINSNVMWKNGGAIELEAPSLIMHDLTYVPLRAVSEAFGASVSWDESTRTVSVIFNVSGEEYDPDNTVVEELHDDGHSHERPAEEDNHGAPVEYFLEPPAVLSNEKETIYDEEHLPSDPEIVTVEDNGTALE